MIEESGRIVAVSDEKVWIEIIRTSACDTCKAQKGCGHGLMNKSSLGQSFQLDVMKNGLSANVGDIAIIGIPEDSLIKASLISYLMPILLLLILAAIGKLLFGELASIIMGMLGLVVGFILVRKIGESETVTQNPILLSVTHQADM